MVAFSTVKPGDVLWDCHRTRMGNTTMSKMGAWTVKIISVDPEKRTAVASWNGNRPTIYHERHIKALRRTRHPQS
jgi:hypothetical protein